MTTVKNFTYPIRVYYEDTDAGGVVYHANYLKFFERARTEMLRTLGYEQDWLRANASIIFVVRSLQIDYLRPALFNELLQVSAKVIDSKKASFTFSQHINRGDELLCTGIVRIACLDAHTLRPKAIPDLSLLHLIQEASFVVQFVMVLLLVASLASWTFIFSKRKELNRAIEITDEFEEQFWSGMALTELYRKLAAKDFKPEGIEKIFLAGYKEFSRMRQSGTVEPAVQVESAQRAMRIEL